MDFNDIGFRIERLHASVRAKVDHDIAKHLDIKKELGENSYSISGTFTKGNNADKANRILLIIHNLANLKDHLKHSITSKGGDQRQIENEIDDDLSLQIVIDLANSEKHTYPTKSNRSGLNPKLGNIQSSLTVSATEPGEASFFVMHIDGTYQTSGNVGVTLHADILDGNNDKVMTLDELIENCLGKWEGIITKYKLG